MSDTVMLAKRTTGENLSGCRTLVMGLGRFGGGIGVSRWLAEQGAVVTVTDQASPDDLRDSMAQLDGLPIEFRLGGHNESDLAACDLLVVSPAVDKARSSFFQAAAARGIAWTSECNLFLERCPAMIVGVTGSVGKSTTTAMLGEVLEKASLLPDWRRGQVWVGGNIGKSLLASLSRMATRDVVVLELSSFQLEDAAGVARSPAVSVLTNFGPNHLDRHGTMASYAAAKRNLFAFQGKDDCAVLPDDAAQFGGESFAPKDGVRRFSYGVDGDGIPFVRRWMPTAASDAPRELIDVSLAVPGRHNTMNAAAAVATADALSVPRAAAHAALAEFRGLPHRLELVREYGGARYFNDSKATTPDAAITALRAFDEPIVLLCGGYDKKLPFDGMALEIVKRCRAVVCFGDTRDAIYAALRRVPGVSESLSIKSVHDFRGGVNLARRLAQSGDVVLLSPGCASFDMFKNYEERGAAFSTIVRDWV